MSDEPIDPVHATSADVSRRGFVTLGSGAAFAIANAGAVAAQTAGFGKPHPPIVAEDDPSIAIYRPKLTPSAGGPIDAYAAAPRTVTQGTPAVVVTMAASGVDSQLRDTVRRYAKAGFIAIAPNLYARLGAPSGDGVASFAVFRPYLMQMFEQGFAPTDLLAARAWVPTLAPSAKIGLTGFCAGGGIALRRLIGSRAFAAASIFYGDVRPAGTPRDAATTPSMFDYTTQIETPVMGNYGARDTSIKAADVQAMFERLTMPHDLKIYPEAGHAFFDDERTSYVATAATDAWTRTLSWFHRYLS